MYTVNDGNVDDIALRLFRYQAIHNPVYARYITYLGTNIHAVRSVNEIPFLPVSFFKNQELKTGSWYPETRFTSSSTTSKAPSTHHIADLNFYLQHAERCFTRFFGPLKGYHFLALMPSYLERGNSSLIAMISSFIKKSESAHSGFYLNEYEKLVQDIAQLKKQGGRKVILWGVSFALLDLAEKHNPDLTDCLIFETGGMKGRRKEITRQELHSHLKKYFNISNVYSEYGMTELLSQAYTRGGDTFYPPPGMKIVIRESVDPFEKGQIERAGGLNVIDLANFHSIAFIETEDAGRVSANGSFEVLGRLDNTDVRGCNLMVE